MLLKAMEKIQAVTCLKVIGKLERITRKEVTKPYCTPCGAGGNYKMKKIICDILKFLILLWGAIFVLPTFLVAEGIVRVLGFIVNTVLTLFRNIAKS